VSDWEGTECLLCGSAAKRYGFFDARGQKYDECRGGCPPYGVRGWLHEHIKLFIKDPADKKKIIEFIKAKVANGTYNESFFEIKPDHLRKLGLLPPKSTT